LLGRKVAIVDPEISVVIGDADEVIVRFGFGAVDADEAEYILLLLALLETRESAVRSKVLARDFDLGGHRLHQAENGAGDNGNFRVARSNSGIDQREFAGVGIEAEQTAQFLDAGESLWGNFF